MRRAWRYILNGLTAMSLLLAVGAAGLWARSYSVADTVARYSVTAAWYVQSNRGSLVLSRSAYPPGFAPSEGPDWHRTDAWQSPACPAGPSPYADPGLRRHWHALGFGWAVTDGGPSTVGAGTVHFSPGWSLAVPHAAAALALALAPALRLRARRRRRRGRRERPGLCPACGYDLRATPDRCPECGRVAGGEVRS